MSGRSPLEQFSLDQKNRMSSKAVYVQADFDFWAATYEPTHENLEELRQAWTNYAGTFPESSGYRLIQKETASPNKRTVLVALFQTDYPGADLAKPALGWGFYPTPSHIVELEENDQVVRALMPVPNSWARYFLVTYSAPSGWDGQAFIVSNRTSKVELKRAL